MENFFAGKDRSHKDGGDESNEGAETIMGLVDEKKEESNEDAFSAFGYDHEDDDGLDGSSDDPNKGSEDGVKPNSDSSEEGGSDDEFEINDETTHFAIIAQEWKTKGILPEDVEIKNDLSSDEVQALYLQAMENTSRSLVRTEMEDKIREKGVDPKILFSEEDGEEVMVKQFDALSKLKWSDLEESKTFDDDMKALAETYISLAAPKLSDAQKEKLVEAEFDDNHPEDLFDKYVKFFGEQKEEVNSKIVARKEAAKQKDAEKAKETRDMFVDKIKSRYEMDEEKAEKFYSDIFDKKHIYKDGNGGTRKVSLFQKRRHEMSKDPDMMLDFADFILNGEDKKTIEKRAKKKGQMSLMDKMAQYKTSKGGKVTKKENRASKSSSNDPIFEDV